MRVTDSFLKHKIGQVYTVSEDFVGTRIDGNQFFLSKGDKCIIGADNLAHYLDVDAVSPIGANSTVEGIDAYGLVWYLCHELKKEYPLNEMLREYGIKGRDFGNVMINALKDIGIEGDYFEK